MAYVTLVTPMRFLLVIALGLIATAPAKAAEPSTKSKPAGQARPKTILVPHGPTIYNLRGFPVSHLRTSLSPRLFKSLGISPVTA